MDYTAEQKRNMIVFFSMFFFFSILLISSLYVELKGKNSGKDIATQITQFKSDVLKKASSFFTTPPKTESKPFKAKPAIDYTNTSPTPTLTASPSPTAYILPSPTPILIEDDVTIEYTIPTFPPRPTFQPGAPGSPEWEAEFNRKWEESKKRYEDGLRDLCEKIPNASVCH